MRARSRGPGPSRRILGPLLLASVAGCLQLPEAHDPLDERAGGGSHATDRVEMQETRFEPPTLRVRVGASVAWTNRDGVRHTVTPENSTSWGSGGSPLLDRGDSWSWTFDHAGDFAYYCIPHTTRGNDGSLRGMVARVVVDP